MTKRSCLDLVIVSKRLVPFVESVLIDSKMEFSPIRPISKTKSVTSDHFPVIVTFKNLPPKNSKKPQTDKHLMWNTNKVGGWEVYENLTREDDLFSNIVNVDKEDRHEKSLQKSRHEKSLQQDNMAPLPLESATEAMNKINKVMTKVKHTAFGKVKIKKAINNVVDETIDSNDNKNLLEQQRKDVEKEFEHIKNLKLTKGKTAAVFKTFDKIRGKSKDGPELVTMKNPETNEFIFKPEEIRETSLKYCVNLLNNKKIDPAFQNEIDFENLIHYLRMKTVQDDDDEEELSRKDFDMRVKKMAEKSKEKYRFILKSGEGYKNCIYRLFSQIWKEEVKPQQWRNTVIIQLYKGKGETFDYNCQRNIHTKEDTPKLFEGIVVDKSKQKLVDNCSKYQIGGIPGHRSQEHLFTVKSVISLYSLLNIPIILQLFDISKYFDQEILKDAMDTLYTYGIKGKLYRLWYELYRDAQIRVKTGAGMTAVEATGDNVAQGSIGGAILSLCSLDKTVTNYFPEVQLS